MFTEGYVNTETDTHTDKHTHSHTFTHLSILYHIYNGKRLGLFANLDSIFHLSNVSCLEDLKIVPLTNT